MKFWILLFIPFTIKAQFYIGPEAAAIGNAGRAAVHPTEGVYLNPASAALNEKIYLATYAKAERNALGRGSEQYTGVITDPNPGFDLKGAFAYSIKNTRNAAGDLEQQDFQLSIATRYSNYFSAGIGIHRQQLRFRAIQLDTAEHDATIGFLITPAPNLGFGVVFYDVFNTDPELLPQTWAAGMTYLPHRIFRLRWDVRYQMQSNLRKRAETGGGFELIMRDNWFLRAGHFSDGMNNENLYTLGLGWAGPRLQFNYAFQQNYEDSKHWQHNFQLSVFF